jgi:hypothetical protein
MPTECPFLNEIEALNGRVQISGRPGESHIGLLVERGELFGGVLLDPIQAGEIADNLLKRARLRQTADM